MSVFASVLLLAVSTTSPPAADASLRFVAKDQPLAGISFGIDAIDGQRRGYGQKTSARLLAGRRTVWYTCPGQASAGARMSFDFEAGGRYELDCSAGPEAVIRRAEDC